jgi:hypothetical protein
MEKCTKPISPDCSGKPEAGRFFVGGRTCNGKPEGTLMREQNGWAPDFLFMFLIKLRGCF